jgi:Arabinose-binding domain of AraC transcription regulator, N-term
MLAKDVASFTADHTIVGEQRVLLGALPRAQLVYGRSRGVTPEELCESAGLSDRDLSESCRFVPYARYQTLWAALQKHCPGVPVGLEFGRFLTADYLGYVGQLFRHASSGLELLHALRLSVR